MARAIFASLAKLYDEIASPFRQQCGDVLRNTTCCAWKVDPDRAKGVEYVFGVVKGMVVSAYKVVAPVEGWHVIPDGAEGAGRRVIPVSDVDGRDWRVATTWTGARMYGPVHYGEVKLDGNGWFEGFALESRPTADGELATNSD